MTPIPHVRGDDTLTLEPAAQALHPKSVRPAQAETGFDPRRALHALTFHWFLFLVLGSLLGGGLGYAAWELLPSKYTTYSVLRVSMLDPSILGTKDLGRNEFVTYMKTQANLIKSPFVLRAAMRDSKIANTATLKRVDDPVQWLEENLVLEFSENSEILKISLTGDNAAELADIVNAVHKAYLKEIVENERKTKQAELTRLEEVQKRWEDYLKAKETNLNVPAPKPPAGSAAAEAAPPKIKIGAPEAARIQEEFRRTQTDLQVARTKYNELNADLARIDAVEVPAQEVNEILDRDLNFKELQFRAERAEKQAESLKAVTVRFPNADYDAAVDKAKTARAAAEDYQRELTTRMTRDYQRVAKTEILKRIKDTRFELMALDTRHKELASQVAAIPPFLAENPAAAAAPFFTYDPQKSDMIHSAKTMEMILDRINLLKVEVQAPPRVRELQQASVPIKKEMKKQIFGTAIAFLFGFAALGALIMLYESRVNRLFGSKDLAEAVGRNIIGVLPDLSSEGVKRSGDGKDLLTDEFMEAIDKVRVNLTRNFLGKRAQLILITSVDRAEGKTTLAGHLAVSLTKTDRKTILVDANFRNPGMHEHLGLPNVPGASEVVRGEQNLADAIQRTAIPNLWFLSAGAFDGAAQQAIGRDKLRNLLDKLRRDFDYVLIDGHALLPVADSYLIAQHCDAILLVARKYISRKHLVEHSYDRVVELGVPHTGLIFMGEKA